MAGVVVFASTAIKRAASRSLYFRNSYRLIMSVVILENGKMPQWPITTIARTTLIDH
jgi:hypothetical protein